MGRAREAGLDQKPLERVRVVLIEGAGRERVGVEHAPWLASVMIGGITSPTEDRDDELAEVLRGRTRRTPRPAI